MCMYVYKCTNKNTLVYLHLKLYISKGDKRKNRKRAEAKKMSIELTGTAAAAMKGGRVYNRCSESSSPFHPY